MRRIEKNSKSFHCLIYIKKKIPDFKYEKQTHFIFTLYYFLLKQTNFYSWIVQEFSLRIYIQDKICHHQNPNKIKKKKTHKKISLKKKIVHTFSSTKPLKSDLEYSGTINNSTFCFKQKTHLWSLFIFGLFCGIFIIKMRTTLFRLTNCHTAFFLLY